MELWSEFTINHLVSHGMFEEQANKVLDRCRQDEILKPMGGRWNDTVDGYPPQMKAVVLLSVRKVAVDWIDENIPMAWFRGMFTD
jgi:hypothetical protein